MLLRPLTQTMPTGASVAVLPDPGSLARAAATVIVDEGRRSVEERGRFTIALSGGSTPKPVYRLLAGPPFTELMPWKATFVFWGDERCVDVSDPRSNERMAREALLDHVPIPADHVYPMRCTAGAPGEAAARRSADEYEALLRRVLAAPGDFRGSPPDSGAALDLVLLGLGDNGHTASLFPGSAVLDERERWVAAALEDVGTAAVTSGLGEQLWRVTLTAPFIDRSRLVLFVVSGAAKAAIVRSAVAGDGDPHQLPALLIRPEPGRLSWLLDQDAGAHLPEAAAESFDDLPDCWGGPSR